MASMSRRVRLSFAAFLFSFAAGVTIWLGPSTVLLGTGGWLMPAHDLTRVVVPLGPEAELVIAQNSDPDALVCIEHPPTPEGLRQTCVSVRALRQWMLAPWANRP